MKVLSFIVPSYNSESFLDKCILSFLSDEVLDKLDIIIVNDGSTDATEKVAEKYVHMYPDSIRIISQENKGHGGALNTGCAAARGKYLKVIDADDWVESANLPTFIHTLEQTNCDLVLTHFHTIDITSGAVRKWRTYPEMFEKAISLDTVMSNWRNYYRCMTFHGITYNTEFYRAYGIRLSEHVFYEDYEYATFPSCYARTILPLDLFIYNYRIGDADQSVSEASRLKRIGHLETVLARLVQESHLASPLPAGGKNYIVTKTQELLLSYLTTVLLIDPNKKNGRQAAGRIMEYVKTQMPEVAIMAKRKYLVFCLMNRLHISKKTWDSFLNSQLYSRLRNDHSFD